MNRRQFLRATAGGALAVGGLAGCGGGGGGNGGGGGGTISDADRSAALASVEDKLAELLGQQLPRDQVNQSMAAFMAANPLFEETGVSDSLSAWGRFTDGRLLVVANSLDPEAVVNRSRVPLTISAGRAGAELPSTAQARLMHSFGSNFYQLQHPVDDLAGYLTDHGYQIQPGIEGDARLATLRQVSNAGFFYINSHGGKGKLKNGAETFVVGSSTLRTDANLNIPEIKDDWDNNRIAYLTASNGNPPGSGLPITDTRLAIAAGFVQQHMSFAPGAVVYVNVCFSAKTDVPDGAYAFIKACHRKGAGVYIGWTGITTVNTGFDTARMFVKQMLGDTQTQPVHTPKQRPFDYEEVIKDLKTKHNLGKEAFGSELVAEPNLQIYQPVTLAPSIQYMLVNEVGRKLVLRGMFGKDKHIVTIGGQAVNVNKWNQEEIEVDLADDGPKSKGPVIVESLGRKSNVRNLTEWIIGMAYTFRPDHSSDLNVSGSLFLRFRADVGEVREESHQTPKKPLRAAIGTRDTQANLAGHGTHQDDEHCTSTWLGQQTFTIAGYGQLPAMHLAARFKVDVNTMKGAIGLDLGSIDPFGPFIGKTDCEAWTDQDGNFHPATSESQNFMVALGELYGQDTFPDPGERPGIAPVPLNAIQITFGPNFTIPAGVVEDVTSGVMRLEWTAVTPSFPPDPNAARSATTGASPPPSHKVIGKR